MASPTIRLRRLHAAQRRIIAESRRYNTICCGRRWGKTVLGVDRILGPALDGYPVGWFAPSYKLLTEAWRALVVTIDPVIRRKNEQEKRLELTTGGVIEFWTLDGEHAGRGRKYKRVVVDEAAMAETLEAAWRKAIRPTLTDFGGDAWFFSTPQGRRNYFHDLYALGLSPDEPEWACWQMPTLANPLIDPAEVEAARRQLSAVEFAQEYGAEFVDTSGAAWFSKFAVARHVHESAEYDPALPVMLAVDVGVETGAVLCQVNETRGPACVNVFADYYSYNVPAYGNGLSLLALAESCCNGRLDHRLADPAGSARNGVGPSLLAEYARAGLSLSGWPVAKVLDSLATLEALVDPAQGEPRLTIHPRCRHLIAAFQGYERAQLRGQWLDRPKDPCHPHEDLIDALRGGLYARLGGRKELRTW